VAPLKNQRHELFAQALAQGKPETQAYVAAGYNPSNSNPHRLSENEGVKQRVAELQNRSAARVEITLEKLLRDLEETKAAAKRDRQHGAAARCTELQAKLSGLLTERREVVNKSQPSGPELDLAKLTDADWLALEAVRPLLERARIKPQTEH
jgi:phage terminase small subunit